MKTIKERVFIILSLPPDVNEIVRKEQVRLELKEQEKLKKPHVLLHIIRQWHKMKTI